MCDTMHVLDSLRWYPDSMRDEDFHWYYL